MRSRGAFLYRNLGFSRRRYYLHLDDQLNCCHLKLKETQVGVLVSGGESKKEGVREFEVCTWSCQQVLLVGSNKKSSVGAKKSSVGACKSYCMNFDSFKIVDSSLP